MHSLAEVVIQGWTMLLLHLGQVILQKTSARVFLFTTMYLFIHSWSQGEDFLKDLYTSHAPSPVDSTALDHIKLRPRVEYLNLL